MVTDLTTGRLTNHQERRRKHAGRRKCGALLAADFPYQPPSDGNLYFGGSSTVPRRR
jgi:hypothetical protein